MQSGAVNTHTWQSLTIVCVGYIARISVICAVNRNNYTATTTNMLISSLNENGTFQNKLMIFFQYSPFNELICKEKQVKVDRENSKVP